MSDEMKKALMGLSHSGHELNEGDELLRSEIINTKLNYLAESIGALAQLCVDLHVGVKSAAIDKFNNNIMRKQEEAERRVIISIEQYKERKK